MSQANNLSLEEHRAKKARLKQLRADLKKQKAELAEAKDRLLDLYAQQDQEIADMRKQVQTNELEQAKSQLAKATQAKEKAKAKWERLTGLKWDDRQLTAIGNDEK
jgi:septum formation inhibitor MinC